MIFKQSIRATCATLLLLAQVSAYAQEPNSYATANDSTQETIELLVGDIFEILPTHNLGNNATYTWILTQDRNFIEAGRAKTFRKRLIQPGSYTLYAEISSDTAHASRTFILNYKPRLPGQASGDIKGSTGALVQTTPSLKTTGRVILGNETQLLKLQPINPDIRPLLLDTNLSVDTDGDGNPSNDIESDQTFFQTDATPLYIWFASLSATQNISITAALPAGATVQTIDVANSSSAQQGESNEGPVGVSMEKTGNRTYLFKAKTDASIPEQTPLLYVWEFGDGQQSLLANPTHEYLAEGDYVVKLRVRNLANGQDVANYSEDLSVVNDPNTSSGSSVPAEGGEPVENGDETNIFASIRDILPFIGIFVGSLIIGALIIFGISKLRGRGKSLSDTLEKMEQTIVKNDESSEKTPPPLTIPPVAKTPAQPSVPPEKIAEREKENAVERPAASPKVEEKNAPSWLKSGLTAPTAQVQTQPAPATPAPKPQPVPPPVSPVLPKPQSPPPVAPPAQPTPPKPAATPSWLQQPAAPAAVPTPQVPTPATPPVAPPVPPKPQTPPSPPAPKPQTPPAPPPPVNPVVPPVVAAPKPVTPPPPPSPPVAQTAPAAVPPWLQPQAPKPAASAQPVPPAPVKQTPPPPSSATQAIAPGTPAQSTAPKPANTPEEPIAFIRAESLNQQQSAPKPENGQNPPPPQVI